MTNIRRKISSKKNVFIAAALIALMAIGSTFAYFVDRDYVTNNFTVKKKKKKAMSNRLNTYQMSYECAKS